MPRISFVIIIIIIILFFVPFYALPEEEASSTAVTASTSEGDSVFGITFFKGWDDTDKTLFVASEILLIADWGQSLDINRKGLSDNNPILNHSSISTVNTYFISWLIANYFIADALPSDYRNIWLGVLIGGEITFIFGNEAAGINIAF